MLIYNPAHYHKIYNSPKAIHQTLKNKIDKVWTGVSLSADKGFKQWRLKQV